MSKRRVTRAEQMVNALRTEMAQAVFTLEAKINTRLGVANPVSVEELQMFREAQANALGVMRDSMIAANSQMVIDMNDTLRGIHARLAHLETVAGITDHARGAARYQPFTMLGTINNLSAALAEVSSKLDVRD